jgi:hypothetical protein
MEHVLWQVENRKIKGKLFPKEKEYLKVGLGVFLTLKSLNLEPNGQTLLENPAPYTCIGGGSTSHNVLYAYS